MESPAVLHETPALPLKSPEELKLPLDQQPLDQQQSPPELSTTLEEVEPPLVQQEAPVQPTEAPEEVNHIQVFRRPQHSLPRGPELNC